MRKKYIIDFDITLQNRHQGMMELKVLMYKKGKYYYTKLGLMNLSMRNPWTKHEICNALIRDGTQLTACVAKFVKRNMGIEIYHSRRVYNVKSQTVPKEFLPSLLTSDGILTNKVRTGCGKGPGR